MTTKIALRAASGFRPVAAKVLFASVLALAVAGCKSMEEPGAYVAGWTLVDPSQVNPIMVSQKPVTLSLRVPRNSQGLSEAQRKEVAGFLEHFRNVGSSGVRLVISVPGGSPNESAAVRAMQDIRKLIADYGFSDTTVAMEPYHGGKDANAPIRLSYLQYVAEAPACGRWPANLAEERRNLNYANFGCAQQKNLAAQIVNPGDLLGPRSMTPADPERRYIVIDKYEKGQNPTSERPPEQFATTRGLN